MSRISLLTCIIFLSVISYFDIFIHGDGDAQNSIDRRTGRKDFSPMWFGPRIGRRKRNPGDLNSPGNENIYYLDIIKEFPWTMVATNEGKPYSMNNFVPRLGRESGEQDNLSFLRDLDLTGADDRPAPPFVPRLGRQSTVYTPRLGRENNNMLPLK